MDEEYFCEISPQLQISLTKILMEGHLDQFKYFVGDPCGKYSVPNEKIIQIFLNLTSDIVIEANVILEAESFVDNIYLIKTGSVRMFDKCYNYITDLESDSFFGDHQVMLDLKAGFIYKNNERKCCDGTPD
tara:strand:+ start:483 stop:875 length:393 start_codon:yes stop_codon:yes gene_type:complete